jgi:arsenate reductase
MAEGWARHLWPDAMEAYSAGVEPIGLNPDAVWVMAEAGVDISSQRSKHLDELEKVSFDYVVTVCDDGYEACPVFPGRAKLIHRAIDDPPRLAKGAATDEARLAPNRPVRDEIKEFVPALPDVFSNMRFQAST